MNRPIISGYGDLNQKININETYIMPTVTAQDKDGNKLNVTTIMKQGDKVIDSIDTSKAGSYIITYTTAPDKQGNTTTVTITLQIIKLKTDTDKVIENGIGDCGLELIDNTYYYRGSNPKNWVQFHNELWRIISIENGSMKLIKQEKIGNRTWDDNSNILARPTNDWNTPATIRTYLNNEYYETLATVHDKIAESSFAIGTVTWDTTLNVATVRANEMAKLWTGYVGLMNASDYVYASTNEGCSLKPLNHYDCKNSNWIFESMGYPLWTMNANTSGEYSVLAIDNSGILNISYNSPSNTPSVYPVIFLKSGVNIVFGNGSKDTPYRIE